MIELKWLKLLRATLSQEVIVVLDGVDEAEAAGWEMPRGLLPDTLPAKGHVDVITIQMLISIRGGR